MLTKSADSQAARVANVAIIYLDSNSMPLAPIEIAKAVRRALRFLDSGWRYDHEHSAKVECEAFTIVMGRS